jgi:hypothetical protein
VCLKEEFGNTLGFTNHCRIVHSIVFKSTEDRLEKCGIVVEDADTATEIMAQLVQNTQSERELASLIKSSDPSTFNAIFKPLIKEYDDVSENNIKAYKPADSSLLASGSRFYIKKRIYIGNTSKYLGARQSNMFYFS